MSDHKLKECPFCKSTDLHECRFNLAGLVKGEECNTLMIPDANGEIYRIECACGCKLDKCSDELYEWYEAMFASPPEQDLWPIMYMMWNRRGDSLI